MRVAPSGKEDIPRTVRDGKAAIEAVRPLLEARQRFAVAVVGAGSTEVLVSLAVEACREFAIPISAAAVLAAAGGARLLKWMLADAVSPGAQLEHLFFDHLAGSVLDVAHAHGLPLPLLRPLQRSRAIEEYGALILRAAGLRGDDTTKFLRERRSDIRAALALDLRARLECREIAELFAEMVGQGHRLPSLSFVVGVADFYATFRRRAQVADEADIYGAAVRPVADCPLVLIDEAHAVPPLGRRAVARLFPRAGVILACEDAGDWFAVLPPGRRLLLSLE